MTDPAASPRTEQFPASGPGDTALPPPAGGSTTGGGPSRGPGGGRSQRTRWFLLGAASAVVVIALVAGLVALVQRAGSPQASSPSTSSPSSSASAGRSSSPSSSSSSSSSSTAAGTGGEPARATGDAGKLAWAPPQLTDPETVQLTADDSSVKLDDAKDYTVVLPDEPLKNTGGVVITGGRNVVLIGGRIEATKRGLFLNHQTGTVHVEGLSIGGEGLKEGIDLDERDGATVQLQNIEIDQVNGTHDTNHADLIQAWSGPKVLRIDGLRGHTKYQGFFLLPTQFGGKTPPELFDIRNVAITGLADSAYLLWTEDEGADYVKTSGVVIEPPAGKGSDRLTRPDGAWNGVKVGPASEATLPAGTPGVDYRSPGYANG
jgi:hypothetical protein